MCQMASIAAKLCCSFRVFVWQHSVAKCWHLVEKCRRVLFHHTVGYLFSSVGAFVRFDSFHRTHKFPASQRERTNTSYDARVCWSWRVQFSSRDSGTVTATDTTIVSLATNINSPIFLMLPRGTHPLGAQTHALALSLSLSLSHWMR